jgi:mono/diheme cytochrome c family protein
MTRRPYAGRWRRLVWRTVAATLATAGLMAGLAVCLLVRQGWYDAGAIDQHWQPVYSLLEWSLRYSVRHHARDIAAPPLTADMAQRGAVLYRQHCVQCHGAPGVAPELATLALQPSPGPLVHMRQRWQHNELYWLISNGVKMTGMPAWQYRLSESERWSVVAFIDRLPLLAPQQAADLAPVSGPGGQGRPGAPEDLALPQSYKPDAARGRIALTQYACHSCHVTPGVAGPTVDVGPPLTHLAGQRYVAGYLPMTEDNLVRWIRFPTDIKPGTAMPALQVSERDARDMARWLLGDHAR